MRPQKQTILHIEGFQMGNCLQAAVASMLDLHIDDVPHFVLKDSWWKDMIEFVESKNYKFVVEPKDMISEYKIGVGYTKRGTYHCVIYKGNEPFFDPHISDDFLLKPDYFYTFIKN